MPDTPVFFLDEMITHLYDLDRAELRRLAWEALLISDGPDKIKGDVEKAAINAAHVTTEGAGHVFGPSTFLVWEKDSQNN